MTEISWHIFKAKFAGKETSSFQELCLYVVTFVALEQESLVSVIMQA